MKKSEVGWLLLLIGIVLGIYALGMDTSVSVDYNSVGGNPLNLPERVSNLDLMSKRTNYLIVSALLFISGIVLIAMPENREIETEGNTDEEAIGEPEGSDAMETDFVADEISKLYALKEKGALSEEEFLQQKQKLLK